MSEPPRRPPWSAKRAAVFALGAGLVAAAVVSWVSAFRTPPLPLAPGALPEIALHRASGVVHVHASGEDGTGSPDEVAASAERAGADFIVITGRNRAEMAAIEALPERPGGPVIIVGAEIETDAGPVIAVGIRTPGFVFSNNLGEVLDDIRFLGGCAFAAHAGQPSLDGQAAPAGGDIPANLGLEVLNAEDALRAASNWTLAVAAWNYPANPGLALRQALGDFASERGLWDRTLSRRFTAAVGGIDSARRDPSGQGQDLPRPAYEALFGLVRTVLHLSEPLPDARHLARRAISRALCGGRSVVAVPALADPSGFVFVARDSKGRSFGPGETVRFAPGISLEAAGTLPAGARLRLMESGRERATAMDSLRFEVTSEGIYRVEAFLPEVGTPWILSNPISILTARSQLARQYAAEPVVDSNVLGTRVIDRFEGETSFEASHDSTSTLAKPILDPDGGRFRGAAALLSFSLGPTPGSGPWCALRDRTSRDLSGRKGLSFWTKADGTYRIQVRVGQASEQADTEEWFISMRTSTAWTVQNVAFAALRPVAPGSTAAFESDRISSLAFVVDETTMPAGSQGQVWIDDLMAY